MKEEISEIRALIEKDRIEEAFVKIKIIAPEELKNNIILLSNRYQNWKRDKRNGLGDNGFERNATINALLETISEIESLERNKFSASKSSIENNAVQTASSKEINKSINLFTAGDDKIQVFISYSHEDKSYLAEMKRHFKFLEDSVYFWDDTKIKPGDIWLDEIKLQIQKSKIAILLISADFFNSDFIANDELVPLLNSASKNGTKILSIILKPCAFTEYPQINRYQSLNNPNKPLSSISKNERELIWVKLVTTVKDIITPN